MRQRLTEEAVYVAESRLRCDHLLWGVVCLAAVADVALTIVGLELCFREANPVARTAVQAAGSAGLVALKLAALLVLLVVYRSVRPLYRRGALVAFSAPQLLAVWHNGLLIARHAGSCP